jgi:outer membrane murein-binding lipoprotein Lpp
MRDPKSLYILIFALSLVIISFVLISIWGYHFYLQPKENDKTEISNKTAFTVPKKDSTDSLKSRRDSVNPELVIRQNNPIIDSTDTTDKILESKLLEYNKLKDDITQILKDKASSPKAISDANEKIAQLQQNIDDLRNQNNTVEKENARLNKMLNQFITENKNKPKSNTLNSSKNTQSNKVASPALLVSRLKFFAIDENKSLTKLASNAIRWEGSFEINISSDKINSTDIYVVIIQPNGRVLLNSAWESGTFEIDNRSKVYSAVLHFDIVKDNHRRLYFSIDSHKFHKGVYKMLVYYTGILIGKMERNLG